MDENAISALKKWRFRPGMKGGKPVDVALNIEVNFSLTSIKTKGKKSQVRIKPKYPDVKVRLPGHDGTVYAILGQVTRAMRKAKIPKSEHDAFIKEATAAEDYDGILRVVQRWVVVGAD